MIKIVHKKDCCGCSACVQKCPRHCISLEEDSEGFLYPQVDSGLCVDCGLCERVCPFANAASPLLPRTVTAVKNPNEAERMSSSSGGVFISLAREIIRDGGVVFGVGFDNNWGACMTCAESVDAVFPMMGSKYLQASMGNAYKDAENFLKEGRKVLFSGCPCQIAGLHGFLQKDYPNLLTVDLLCHGVPSPGVWRRYLDETFSTAARRAAAGKNTVLPSSLNSMSVITGIKFRDKTRCGWKKYSFAVRGRSASKADKNSVLLSVIYNENPFMRGFLADLYLRPSCHACKCKGGASHSDITIGDYWGIDRIMPDFDDDKGVSVVLLNTPMGGEIFDRLEMETRDSSLKDVVRYNKQYHESAKAHPKRALFYKRFNNGVLVYKAVQECLYVPLYIRTFRFGKRCIKKLKALLKG